MRAYGRLWRVTWFAVGMLGVGLAVLQWSAIGFVLTLLPLVVLCRVVAQFLPDLLPASARWSIGRHPGRASLTVAIWILSVWSFGRLTPALGLFVVLTAGLTCPAVIGRAVRSARGSTMADVASAETHCRLVEDIVEGSRLTDPEAMGPLQGLDDRQLCRMWRESFWVLGRPASPETQLCVVALREACLDELERRDAGGLQAWLHSGARASSGPEKYLTIHGGAELHLPDDPPRRGDLP